MSAIDWITYVMAYTHQMSLPTSADVWACGMCHCLHACRCVIGILHAFFFFFNFYVFILGQLANFCCFLNGDGKK